MDGGDFDLFLSEHTDHAHNTRVVRLVPPPLPGDPRGHTRKGAVVVLPQEAVMPEQEVVEALASYLRLKEGMWMTRRRRNEMESFCCGWFQAAFVYRNRK